jgi:RNA polymerase sigma-70 factor (ECF subfamily)
LKLRIFEDRTFAEIAEQLQIPLGTALSRMRLALEKLRANEPEEDHET